MSDAILLKTFEGHIKGYGFMSDLSGDTHYGIPLKEAEKFEKIWEEFEEDPELELYEFNIRNCPPSSIPRGTLYIFGQLKKPITNDEIAKTIGWVKTYEPHSPYHKAVPYWDDDGAYMMGAWDGVFEPITDIDDAMYALEHLVNTEKITAMEICKFIMERKEQS